MKYGYFAFEGFEKELLGEIQHRTQNKNQEVIEMDRLFLLEDDLDLVWAQLKLRKPHVTKIESINDAVKKLREKKNLWAPYSFQLHRRTELIQEKIYKIKKQKLQFLQKPKDQDFGFWCLLKEDEILAFESTQNLLPLGNAEFEEDKKTPPSRAYLKLWEAFTLHIPPPKKNEVVIDMGSCPGGWTWVLQTLGCQVISVDKAPLDPNIQKLPNIEFVKKDAFKLNPKEIQKPDWFFSDIICEPPRLLKMAKDWIQQYPDLKFVCTIKYKGSTDFKTTDEFLKIPGSKIIHLCANKHEVTWIKA